MGLPGIKYENTVGYDFFGPRCLKLPTCFEPFPYGLVFKVFQRHVIAILHIAALAYGQQPFVRWKWLASQRVASGTFALI